MAAAMGDDYRETLKQLESKQKLPEYNLAAITSSLESMQETLKTILKVAENRKKRLQAEERQREHNRRLEKKLARDHDELAVKQEQQQDELEDVNPALEPADEEVEPAVSEPLCLAPPKALPVVDLTPLGLGVPDGPESRAMLQQLLVTGQLFEFTGAYDAESIAAVVRVLFQVISYGDSPFSAYEQLRQHYSEPQSGELGWVPQLPDFLGALNALGCLPARGHHHQQTGGGSGSTGGRRCGGSSEGAVRHQGADEAGPSTSGPADGGPRFANLQCLLRLLRELLGAGRIACDNEVQGKGKELFLALLRILLDADVSAVLYGDVRAALEALVQPWDDTLWRRIRDDTAQQAAELGPSHRAAYRVIAAVQGFSGRLRTWQQCAALQLLRRGTSQVHTGARGSAAAGPSSGGSHRGQDGVDCSQVRTLLGPDATTSAAKALLERLRRPQDRTPDYWRLFTVLQCANLVVWDGVYGAEDSTEAGGEGRKRTRRGEEEEDNEEEEEDPARRSGGARAQAVASGAAGSALELARWLSSFLMHLEQRLRGQDTTVMQIRVFLGECRLRYEEVLQ